MKRMDYQEGCEKLREVGFTVQEIEKLCILRNMHVEQEIHRNLTSQRQVKHENWFEQLMRKILSLCRYSAECEASIWMYDNFPINSVVVYQQKGVNEMMEDKAQTPEPIMPLENPVKVTDRVMPPENPVKVTDRVMPPENRVKVTDRVMPPENRVKVTDRVMTPENPVKVTDRVMPPENPA